MALTQSSLEKRTVVIVDDDTGNASILEILLLMGTHYVPLTYKSAMDVLEHLEEIQQSHPAFFFVDYRLPRVNGLALCEQLHRFEAFQYTPMVLISASTEAAFLHQAQQRGIIVVPKPYDIDTVFSTMKRLSIETEGSRA